MSDLNRIFDGYTNSLMEKDDKTDYLKHVGFLNNIGKFYCSKILNFMNEDKKLYGQRGFSHYYLIEFEDVVSVCSGYYPSNINNLYKIDSVLNITEDEKELFLEETLQKHYDKGAKLEWGVDKEFFDLKPLNNKEAIDKKLFVSIMHHYIEAYDDYISGHYMEPGNHRWNLESNFWLYFRRASRISFSPFRSKEEVSSLEHGKFTNTKVDRKYIFDTIMESFKEDDILGNMEFLELDNSIKISNILVEKNLFDYLSDSTGNILKINDIFVNGINYDVYELTLLKEV